MQDRIRIEEQHHTHPLCRPLQRQEQVFPFIFLGCFITSEERADGNGSK
ncbi:MAG: hypothetical protein Ct9H300mP14_00370 [Gammaproteobacteria bacterium]|nr:MAG: hypothetical protein Ct9H300mP14_00370 [Gammaproteobacteria bacterium]